MFLFSVFATLLTSWLAIRVGQFLARRKQLTKAIEKLPGPTEHPVHPIFDTVYLMLINRLSIKQRPDKYMPMYEMMLGQCKLFEHLGIFRFYLGFKPVVVLFSPENIEPIMTSTSVLDKADEYGVFEPWIGEGLVTSKRTKWQSRRKVLTPAFHFRILNDFLPIMNEEATKLIRKLNHPRYLHSFDVVPVVALCTLDTICETAMGVNINCQANEHSDYVRALYDVGQLALARVTRPWLWPGMVFYRTRIGRKFAKAKECTHEFTKRVILNRKREWLEMLASRADQDMSELSFVDMLVKSGPKKGPKRLAFLDLLLHEHLIGGSMSIGDIQEEVDTFMFAGHDTTAMNISWTLYMLGLHQDKQDRVRQELDEIFGGGGEGEEHDFCGVEADHHPNRKLRIADVTSEHLARMKYLEMVIKESLRMWPSIPFVARQMTQNVRVGSGYVIPEGSTCMIFTHALHTNSRLFPKPEVFEPERFASENTNSRHPFAYIPFSAGPRNCIGQKFAQMEVKVILTKIIRNYRIEATIHPDKLKLAGEMVLRSTRGLHVKLTPR